MANDSDQASEPKGKSLPLSKDGWEECRIIEDIGDENEHSDQFYRYGDYGVEACRHGRTDFDGDPTYEAYVIMDGHPYKIDGCCSSFEDAVAALVHERNSKRVEEGEWREYKSKKKGGSVITIDFEEIAKSSISDMISRNREDRKAPKKVEIEDTMPPMAEGQTRTPRSMLRTVSMGEGKDRALPREIEVHDEQPEGSSRRKAS